VTILLDSAIVIDALRGHASALAFLEALPDKPHLSVVSISELRDGQRGEREGRQIDAILADIVLHDVTRDIAETSGKLMRRFRKSHGLSTPDALIAATAIQHSLELATLNLKHFPMFPELTRPY
jgi:predicted nucleic acid-binding protein